MNSSNPTSCVSNPESVARWSVYQVETRNWRTWEVRDGNGRVVVGELWENEANAIVNAHNAESSRFAPVVEALEVAQKWLANCVPIVDLDGPKPLPLIAAALSTLAKEQEK